MKKKKYVFEFMGEKEDFFNILNSYHSSTSFAGDRYYYFDDFIVRLVGEKIYFGVQRGGHSAGGYWYIPTIIECDDRIEFCGTIEYTNPNTERGKLKEMIDRIDEFLLLLFLLPVVLLIKLYMLVEWVVRKLLKKPKPKEQTTEERLFDLMENHLCCIRK